MGRDIRFLAGIHRSGNTVLASILNQNPDFYIEGISPLVGLMWETDVFKSNDELSLINNHQKSKLLVPSLDVKKVFQKEILLKLMGEYQNP